MQEKAQEHGKELPSGVRNLAALAVEEVIAPLEAENTTCIWVNGKFASLRLYSLVYQVLSRSLSRP